MNDGTPLGVRVQEAFMASVLIGPTTKTNKQQFSIVSTHVTDGRISVGNHWVSYSAAE
jgi:hypothetical protein